MNHWFCLFLIPKIFSNVSIFIKLEVCPSTKAKGNNNSSLSFGEGKFERTNTLFSLHGSANKKYNEASEIHYY